VTTTCVATLGDEQYGIARRSRGLRLRAARVAAHAPSHEEAEGATERGRGVWGMEARGGGASQTQTGLWGGAPSLTKR